MMMGLYQIGIAAENAFAHESNSYIGQKAAAGISGSRKGIGRWIVASSHSQLHQNIFYSCNV